MVSYFNKDEKFLIAKWIDMSRENRASRLGWVGVIKLNIIREYQSECIKYK